MLRNGWWRRHQRRLLVATAATRKRMSVVTITTEIVSFAGWERLIRSNRMESELNNNRTRETECRTRSISVSSRLHHAFGQCVCVCVCCLLRLLPDMIKKEQKKKKNKKTEKIRNAGYHSSFDIIHLVCCDSEATIKIWREKTIDEVR